MSYFVYALYDSGNLEEIKYIGAASWDGRPLMHEKESLNLSNKTYKHNSIRKLLREGRTIIWQVLEFCSSWKETLSAEARYILEYKTKYGKRPDWNFTDGGAGGSNISPEVRAQRSYSNRVAHSKPEVKERHRKGVKSAMNRPGVQDKLHTPELDAKRSISNKIAQNRPEIKAVTAESSKRVWSRPGEKERRSLIMRAVHQRESVKINQKAASLRGWNKPGEKERRTLIFKNKFLLPEVRARKSAAAKLVWEKRRLLISGEKSNGPT
jgi:hypothetical protein